MRLINLLLQLGTWLSEGEIMKRSVPLPGLSYVDSNQGRLCTFTQDVLGYKETIHAMWPELHVVWDMENEEWAVIETDKHGAQTLVFASKTLGEHTVERLQRAQNCNSDALAEIESWNAKLEKESEARATEALHAAGEKLAWAIRKDEFNGPEPRIFYDSNKQSRLAHAG